MASCFLTLRRMVFIIYLKYLRKNTKKLYLELTFSSVRGLLTVIICD